MCWHQTLTYWRRGRPRSRLQRWWWPSFFPPYNAVGSSTHRWKASPRPAFKGLEDQEEQGCVKAFSFNLIGVMKHPLHRCTYFYVGTTTSWVWVWLEKKLGSLFQTDIVLKLYLKMVIKEIYYTKKASSWLKGTGYYMDIYYIRMLVLFQITQGSRVWRGTTCKKNLVI